jgi:hypothetical protein
MEYDNTNRGVLFKNDRKEKETHSDYNGTININGKEHYLDAWLKESKNGGRFMSLSIGKEKGQPAAKKEESFEDVPW